MSCPSDFTCALYADGELDPGESRRMAVHLDGCPRCRTFVASLEAENRWLVTSVREIPDRSLEPVPALDPAFPQLGIRGLVAGIFGVAILLRMGLVAVSGVGYPGVFDWLDPFSLAGRLNWLTSGLFYLVGDGGVMIASYLADLSLLVFNLLILTSLMLAARRLRPARAVLGLGALLMALALPSHAIDIRGRGASGGGPVIISSDEIVNDTLVVFGESVRIDGRVTGDLIAFAQRIDVSGTVEGNVISFGQNIEIGGIVEGDLVSFSQSLRVAGEVGQDLWRFGQSLGLEDTGSIEGNATVFGATTDLNGVVRRDLTMAGGTLNVDGSVGGDIDFRGNRLSVRAPAMVGGGVRARVRAEQNVEIDPGATVGGEQSVEVAMPSPSQYTRIGYYVRQVLRIGAAFVTALVLFWLFPGLDRVDLGAAKALLTAAGLGFLGIVATPVAALFIALTLVGLPLAVLALVLWGVGLYLSKIMVAAFLGSRISGREGMPRVWGLLAGLSIILLVVNLPFVGGVINFLLILIGFGALLTASYRMSRWSGSAPMV